MRVTILVTLLCLVSRTSLAADDELAQAALATVRIEFAHRSQPETIAALDELARRFPSTEAAGRALLWGGDLEQAQHHEASARAHYIEAGRRFGKGEINALAARGLGNVALAEGRYDDATCEFDRAIEGGSAMLKIELGEKRRLAMTGQRRYRGEIAAWCVLVAVAGYFLRNARRTPKLRLPLPTIYLAPIQLVMIAACCGRDPNVMRALIYLGVGSLAISTLAFLPPPTGAAPSSRRLTLECLLLVAATVSLFWIAIRRAGIVDALLNTLEGGAQT